MAERIQWIYNIFLVLALFISMAYGINKWEKIKEYKYLKLFPFYLGVSFLLDLIWFFNPMNFPGIFIQNIFIIFELVIFYNLFIKVFKDNKFNIVITILEISFFVLAIIIVLSTYSFQKSYSNLISFLKKTVLTELIVIENIFIVTPIILYYVTLFNRPYIKNLSSNPTFLAMTGILFGVALTIPVLIFKNAILAYSRELFIYLYVINSIAYIIMYLFFIKAFKRI
jgi:hypothetical protein